MDWVRLLSSRRFRAAETQAAEDGRSEFQKDYDRIVFSRAFRRLQGKTQVHPMPDNDHVHTRLTHTLEVASVGRSLGVRVGLSLQRMGKLPASVRAEDIGSILQAACLAHDIGNPPFGHAGEFAIRDWFKRHPEFLLKLGNDQEKLDLQMFEGNAQGLRVLTQLEGHLFDGGLRTTFATLGTFIKYPWSSGNAKKDKFGFFQTERSIMEEIAAELGLVRISEGRWARHPLVYLVEAADDICYAIIDLEDAWEVGIVSFGEIESILLAGGSVIDTRQYAQIGSNDLPRRLNFLRGKVVDFLVREAVEAFIRNEQKMLLGQFDGDLISECGQAAGDIVQRAKLLAKEKIFKDLRKTQIEIGAYSIIDVLMDSFCHALFELRESPRPSFKTSRVFDLLNVNAPTRDDDLYRSLVRITDFVSGSTDKYATNLSRGLTGVGF